MLQIYSDQRESTENISFFYACPMFRYDERQKTMVRSSLFFETLSIQYDETKKASSTDAAGEDGFRRYFRFQVTLLLASNSPVHPLGYENHAGRLSFAFHLRDEDSDSRGDLQKILPQSSVAVHRTVAVHS